MGMSIAKILKEKNSGDCGYFGIKNVITEEREDYMESFFLAETTKYLYMLSKKTSSLLDYFVLNTEVKFDLVCISDTFRALLVFYYLTIKLFVVSECICLARMC